MSDARGGPGMNVNGGRSNMNLFTLNGGYFNNPSRNTGMNYPPPDAVQEVRILTHNFAAEYGRNPGSQVNVVSRAGTNAVPRIGMGVPPQRRAECPQLLLPRACPRSSRTSSALPQEGRSSRTRFSSSAHIRACATGARRNPLQAFVPTDAQRAGDFTASGVTLTNAVDPLTGRPFTNAAVNPCVTGNRIANGLHQPRSDKIVEVMYPTSPTGQVSSLAASPRDGDQYMFRGDWNQSARHRIYGSWFEDETRDPRPSRMAATFRDYMGENFDQKTQQLSINDT